MVSNTRHPSSVVQVYELQSEVGRLRILVKVMMDRMELYEKQSECLVEASLEHNVQWKKATLDKRYDRTSKTRLSTASPTAVRLSSIKGLLEEQSMTDQWIRKVETVQRGYQERVMTTQNQLKTLRYEQVQTNKQIIEMKRAGKSKANANANNNNGQQQPTSLPTPPTRQLSGSSNHIDWNNGVGTETTRTIGGDPNNNIIDINNIINKNKNNNNNNNNNNPIAEEQKRSSMVEDMVSTWHEEVQHNPEVVKMGGMISSNGIDFASGYDSNGLLQVNGNSIMSSISGSYHNKRLVETTKKKSKKKKKDAKKRTKKKKEKKQKKKKKK